MRWSSQSSASVDPDALAGLDAAGDVVRSVTSPELAGVTFHEVLAKSALNRVPGQSEMPFGWTVNPYRGCSHACVYCFARPTHSYLDLNAGEDFDNQVVVKVNVGEVLRRELLRPSWGRHPVALGTNTDPYQRAEGKYRLMPDIVEAFVVSGTPFSILTKGTLLRRDLPLLADASRRVGVDLAMSIAIYDPELQAAMEPGTPSAAGRLATVSAVREAGLDCGVFLMPILPYLSDGIDQLDDALRRCAAAGATSVQYTALHLRKGVKPWFMHWLERNRPELVPRYTQMYAAGSYAPAEYRSWLADRMRPLLHAHGLERRDDDPSTGGIRSSALGMYRTPEGEREPRIPDPDSRAARTGGPRFERAPEEPSTLF